MTESAWQQVAFVVEPHFAGWRLDKYLTAKLRTLSRSHVQRLIAHGLSSEHQLKPATAVWPGLTFFLRKPVLPEPETPEHVPVLFRDDALLVVDKPAGLPVHPSARYRNGTLVGRLQECGYDRAEPAHRLDRETSGLVICARTPEVSRYFMHAFKQGEVHKTYAAICEGAPPHDEFEVNAPIATGGELIRIGVRIDETAGRPACTRFRVLERFARGHERFALLLAVPLTGRQHQIRVHLRHAGWPLVGDKIYGPSEAIYDRFSRHAMEPEDWQRLRLRRHALHAWTLDFRHPTSGARCAFSAPLPSDLVELAGREVADRCAALVGALAKREVPTLPPPGGSTT